jgi:4-hydroxybenzoate polyprenyltransferase
MASHSSQEAQTVELASARITNERLLYLESLFWITRVSFVWTPIFAPAGWFAARGVSDFVGLALAMLALGCAGSVVAVLNDLLDLEKDRVTAPYLPLPSGLITPRVAMVEAAVLAAGFVFFLSLSSASTTAFLKGIAVAVGAGLLVAIYTYAKRVMFASLVVAAVVYAGIATIAWCAAGGGGTVFIWVFGCMAMFGLGTNTYTSMKDMHTDPLVGNTSLAGFYGAPRGYLVGAGADLSASFFVLMAAVQMNEAAKGVVLCLVCMAGVVVPHLLHRAHVGWSATAQRRDWARFSGVITHSRLIIQVALIAVFSVGAAILLAPAFAGVLFSLGRTYERRVVSGELSSLARQ